MVSARLKGVAVLLAVFALGRLLVLRGLDEAADLGQGGSHHVGQRGG